MGTGLRIAARYHDLAAENLDELRSKTRKPTVGLHLPSAKEIKRAADQWQRRQSLRAGSGYFSTPPFTSRNLNRKFA